MEIFTLATVPLLFPVAQSQMQEKIGSLPKDIPTLIVHLLELQEISKVDGSNGCW